MVALSTLARWVWSATIMGGLLVAVILLAKWAAGSRLGARWHYFVWALLLVRLAVPVLPASPVSLYHLLHVDRLVQETFPAGQALSNAGGLDPGVLPGTGASGTGAGTIGGVTPGHGTGNGDGSGVAGGGNPATGNSGTVEGGSASGAGQPASSETPGGSAPASWTERVLPVIFWIWAAGVLAVVAATARAEIRFRVKVRNARRIVSYSTRGAADQSPSDSIRPYDSIVLACFAQAKRRMRLESRKVDLWESYGVESPVAFGLVRPRLVLPAALADRLDEEQLTDIFCHELAHIRRYDIAVNWLAAALRALHWFNPLVWLGLRRMQEDQELSCDAMALARLEPGAARGYGRTILSLLEIMSATPVVPSTTGVRGNAALNRRRMTMIALSKKASLKWSLVGLAVAVLLAGCALTNPQAAPQGNNEGNFATSLSGVLAVKMIDANVGWALTGSGVYRTTDGGAKWAVVTPAEVTTAAGGSVAYAGGSLAAVDANSAYATFGAQGSSSIYVFGTSDAGRNWTRAEIAQEAAVWNPQPASAPPVAAFEFADASHGWLLATYGVAMGSEGVRLYATADAAVTWQLIDDVTGGAPLASGSLPFGGHKTGLGFIDAASGWVSGFDYGDNIVLHATKDGGKTWALQAITAPAGYSTAGGSAQTLAPVFFALNAKDGILPVQFLAKGGQPTIFYATHDGGATWQATTIVTSETNDPMVWSFADPEHGFVTDGSKLYVTADGGSTWQTVTPNVSLKNADGTGRTQLDFVSADAGWAVVGGSLLKTTDGGQTWQ